MSDLYPVDVEEIKPAGHVESDVDEGEAWISRRNQLDPTIEEVLRIRRKRDFTIQQTPLNEGALPYTVHKSIRIL